MRPPQSFPQSQMTDEQRSIAASYEIARQQNAKNLDKAVLMIELRKWCLEKALLAPLPDSVDVVDMAKAILDFVSMPLQE
jgi:hypothetical protein